MADSGNPVRITALQRTVAATTVWRSRGRLHVTVVVKATFALRPGGAMIPVEPEPIARTDRHHGGDPTMSVRVQGDLGPFKSRADVTLGGHAYAPRNRAVTVQAVRLALFHGGPLLDKTVHVHGGLRGGVPQPFDRIPLVYEHAFGGPAWDENPVGVGASEGRPQDPSLASIASPDAPGRTAGFGPIAGTWPARRRLLGGLSPSVLEQPIAEIPDGFEWSYFQGAPADQRVDYLQGDEWVVVEGVHPNHPQLKSHLPGARGAARVYGLSPAAPGMAQQLEMRADTLHVDADALRCTLAWRGLVAVPDEAALAALQVIAGVEMAGLPIQWPEAPAAGHPFEGTMMVDDDEIEDLTSLRLVVAAGGPVPREASPSSPGSPSPLPAREHALSGTVMDDEPAPSLRPALPFRAGTAAPPKPEPSSPGRLLPLPSSTHPLSGTVMDDEPAPSLRPVLPFGAGAVAPPRPPPSSPARLPPPSEEHPLSGTMAVDEGVMLITLPFVAPEDAPPASVRSAPDRFAPPPAREHPLTGTLSDGAVAPSPRPALPFAGNGAALGERAAATWDAGGPASTPVPGTATPDLGEAPASAAPLYHRLERPGEPGPRADAPPRIEPRAADSIPIVTRTSLLAFTLPWEAKPGQPARAVVVKATFDLVPDGPAKLRGETEPPTGDVHAADNPLRSLLYPSDFVLFKPGVDVTLKGHAYAPGGGAPAALVRFRFGRPRAAAGRGFDRSIAVFGERRWQEAVIRLAPTEPRRFDAIPLVYENAFGGPELEKNPVGAGHGASARLPNLEDPAHLVKSPGDTPEPACFGAVPMRWHTRWSRLGAYGGDWLETRWPHFPADFDWTFFQAAPPSQQLERVEGDEPFELVGMSPEHPSLQGSLPRLLPRCFARKTTRAVEEIVLRLDTVTFDVDEMKLNLVWRGMLEVADDAATDVVELFLMAEAMGGPHLGPAEVEAKYQVARRQLSLLAQEPDEPAPANQTTPEEPLGAYEKQLREKLRAAGVIEAAPPSAAVLAPPPPPPEAAEEPEPPPAPRPPPHIDPDRARAVQLLARGEPLDGVDLAEADLSDLDFSGRSLAGANLKDARLVRCRFAGANLAGAQLGGADLTEAVLDGADLQRADFTGANLEAASLTGVNVLAAIFVRARGERAAFREAWGAQASFAEGSWAKARFDRAELPGADFTGAALDEAVFDGAALPQIRLHDARGSRVSFKDATLVEARADGVCLLESSLQGVSAESSVWDGATLDASSFMGANLKGSGFAKASCQRAVFSGADLTEGRLARAKLAGASFLKANLMTSSLEAADLTGADLRGANLHGAETWKAKLKGARLDLAVVTQTKLEVNG